MSKSVMRKLIKANRYNDFHKVIFRDVVNNIDPSTTIFYYEGATSKFLSGKDIIREAEQFFTDIDSEMDNEMNSDDFENFRCYVEDVVEMKLINFAIDVSHRDKLSYDMDDDIRVWLIIRNILDILKIGELNSFKIPKGWKKVNLDNNAKNINNLFNNIFNGPIGNFLRENPDLELTLRKVK